jgi:hypothetical protein
LKGLRKITNESVTTADFLAKIQTTHLSHRSLEHYREANLLSCRACWKIYFMKTPIKKRKRNKKLSNNGYP